jgi:LuxR family maltose regulon positive regulatory protein
LKNLIDLKNIIPAFSKGIIYRKSLIKQLNMQIRDENKKLLLISGPAGYGKTTLITSWINQIDINIAWLTIDEEDNKIKSFIQGVINSFQVIDDKLFEGTNHLLQLPNQDGLKAILSSFYSELRLIEQDIILIFDDFHHIENNDINQLLDKVIKYSNDNIKLVLLTREDPQIKLRQYRLEDMIFELRTKDLKFTLKEAKKLFANMDLNDKEVKDLTHKTEGWISGLKLAGIKLLDKDEKINHKFIEDFSGSNYYIMDYLLEEVLYDLDDNIKNFLLKTSVLDKLSPPLCNYILDRDDSLELLQKIQNMNLFIEEVDTNNHWYRYHQLFRDLLSFQLDDNQRNDLHLRAAEWFAQNGIYDSAVSEALKAEQTQLAVRYIEEAIPTFLEEGKIKGLLYLIEKLSDQSIMDSIPILIMKAWSLFVVGKKNDAIYYINIIQNNIDEIDEHNKGRLYTLTSLIPEINNQKDPTLMAKGALELIPKNDHIFTINAWMSLGQIQASLGRKDESIDSFKKAYFLARKQDNSFLEIISLINLALKLNQKGKLKEANKLCNDTIDRYSDSNEKIETLAKLIYIPKGIFAYQMGEFKAANNMLISGIEVSEQLNLIHVAWMPKIYYAVNLYTQNDTPNALAVIEDLIAYTNKYNLLPHQQWVKSIKDEIYIKEGKLKLTKILDQKFQKKLNSKDNFNYIRELFNYIRLLLLDQKTEQAISLLEDNLPQVQKIDFTDKIRYYLLLTISYYLQEDENNTENNMMKINDYLNNEKYLSIFIREGKMCLPLIKKYKYLNTDLFNSIENILEDKINNNVTKLQQLVEPLTERELEILNLAASGFTNQKIADELFITLGTTKWHLSNVYSKLGVKSRTKAAVKAKELGLINE